jgi:hypothetical protein
MAKKIMKGVRALNPYFDTIRHPLLTGFRRKSVTKKKPLYYLKFRPSTKKFNEKREKLN